MRVGNTTQHPSLFSTLISTPSMVCHLILLVPPAISPREKAPSWAWVSTFYLLTKVYSVESHHVELTTKSGMKSVMPRNWTSVHSPCFSSVLFKYLKNEGGKHSPTPGTAAADFWNCSFVNLQVCRFTNLHTVFGSTLIFHHRDYAKSWNRHTSHSSLLTCVP